MEYLAAHWSDLLEAVLAVLGAASAVARITPTETDDKILAKVYGFVHALGLTKPK